MNNVVRTLIFDKQVSLTLIDGTELVKEGIRLHKASPDAGALLGKALLATAFMSSSLKAERGEISIALQSQGLGGNLGVSGNHSLHIRGYIENPNAQGAETELLGKEGALTVIRDDGYSRPFVGSCGFPENARMDALIEEYFRISEQLPTRVCTVVEYSDEGARVFAGLAALQPLPFASQESLRRYAEMDLRALVLQIREKGAEETAKTLAKDEPLQGATARYQCNCSRKYLSGVLMTLGEKQLREIIQSEGEVKAHCHYCNTDYAFTEKDIDGLFLKDENKKDAQN